MVDIAATPQDVALNALAKTPAATQTQSVAARSVWPISIPSQMRVGLDGIIRKHDSPASSEASYTRSYSPDDRDVLFVLMYSWSSNFARTGQSILA